MYLPDIIPPAERGRYAKGNMGKRVGFGARPAVLVVDMTRAFTADRFPLGCTAAGVPCARDPHAARRRAAVRGARAVHAL